MRAVVAVADATLQPTPEGILAGFDELVGPQLTRLERAGLKAGVALGVHPLVLPRRGLGQVLDALPGYLRSVKVVALGQLGLRRDTPAEHDALLAQLELAHRFDRPAIVVTPVENHERITRRTLALLGDERRELDRARILIDGATPRTVRGILALGFKAGLTVHPEVLDVDKAVGLVRTLGPAGLLLGDAAGHGSSDIVSLGRAAHRLARAGLSARVIRLVTSEQAARFFGL